MRYLSVCSGIEAASVAWHGPPLNWEAAGFAEIEPFPCAVLQHHYPKVKNFGDFTKIGKDDVGAIDLLVGGTPCQDFSVAGLRAGLAGDRGAITIEFLHLAERLRPRWLVWENVPGVLSADGGRAFGTFLGLLGKLGYGFAYRVFDAQYFGLAQRRRRVFVVGHFGDWRRAAAVLFERHSLSGNPSPRRQAGQVAPTIPSRSSAGGGLGTDFDCDGGLICAQVAPTLVRDGAGVERTGNERTEADFLIAHTLRAEGFDASEDGTGRGVPLVTAFDTTQITSAENRSNPQPGDPCHPLASKAHVPAIASASSVRRLTPVECERLQGFPDDWTLVPYRGKPASDGPRYRSLGNSFAVPVIRWIGERIGKTARVT